MKKRKKKTKPPVFTEPPKLISDWDELDGLLSVDGKHIIRVDEDRGSGWIEPVEEVPDSEYWLHHEYLSTHTFYEKSYKDYTEILRNFGFNVELKSWG